MKTIVKYIKSIFMGDFLTVINAHKNVPFILYVFVLIIAYITINLLIEKTMTIRENNAEIIENLKIDYTHKSLEVVSIDTRSKVEEMLRANGSSLKKPEEAPAQITEE